MVRYCFAKLRNLYKIIGFECNMSFQPHTMRGEMAGLGLVVCQYTKGYNAELIPFIDRNLRTRFSAEVQERHAATWQNLDPTATVLRERTIEGALDLAREIATQDNGIQALVTGSLHLVSGVLYFLEHDGFM
ncbi:folylpolyglutamate synthase [Phlyctema vagabunda]|uniref:Folylpolyglutamate synthase n=1 Tax=Phlyctema vagabunda TaxID=108571 RepID=A0ABR4PVD9_9HELO